MNKSNKYSPEVRQGVVRLVQEHRREYQSLWAVAASMAPKIGCVPQTLLECIKRAEVDAGGTRGIERSPGRVRQGLELGKF